MHTVVPYMASSLNQRSLVKIFGERNTSTCAIKQLIERNSDSEVLPSIANEIDKFFLAKRWIIARLPYTSHVRERYIDSIFSRVTPLYSWKHTATYFEDVSDFTRCFVIIMIRHPASWLLALHRRSYHALQSVPPNFGDFIAFQRKTVKRESLDQISCTPLDLYNYKSSSYLDFTQKLRDRDIGYSIVRFEDFANDQIKVFDRIKKHLKNPKNEIKIVEQGTKEITKDRAYYKEYYDHMGWLDEIDESDKNYIDQKIDWEVGRKFGTSTTHPDRPKPCADAGCKPDSRFCPVSELVPALESLACRR